MSEPVLTVTLNPAIDLHLETDAWREDEPMRATDARRSAGGKGVNVARVLGALGVGATAAVAVGGLDGDVYLELAKNFSFEVTPLRVSAPTRTNVTVAGEGGARRIKVNQPGVAWGTGEWLEVFRTLKKAMEGRAWVVLAGALPPEMDEDSYCRLAAAAKQAGARVAIDCEGPALLSALSAAPDLVRINRSELARTTGLSAANLNPVAAAQSMLGRGARAVVVSDGAGECLMVDEKNIWRAIPPAIEARGILGAGDAMLAGMIAGWIEGNDETEALKNGMACGAACARANGFGGFQRSAVSEFKKFTAIEKNRSGII